MNPEQLKSAVRWMIAPFGPFLIAHGYASSGTLELAGGVLVSLAPLIWGMFTHTESNAVTVVDAIAKEPGTPVKAVILDSSPAGKELAAALPGDTTVVAGTTQAAAAARP